MKLTELYKNRLQELAGVIPKMKDGDCYKNVYNYLIQNDLPSAYIVHGEVTNSNNKTMKHAWIENGESVIDPTTGVDVLKEKYYQILNPKIDKTYDLHDIIKMTMKIKNYGPWADDEIKSILNK